MGIRARVGKDGVLFGSAPLQCPFCAVGVRGR